MYCRYYGFSEDPFQLTPDPQFLFLDEVYREAMAHLEEVRRIQPDGSGL